MFKDNKYSVISKTYITSFSHFLLLSTSNVRMPEGTFCRVEVHIMNDTFFETIHHQILRQFADTSLTLLFEVLLP